MFLSKNIVSIPTSYLPRFTPLLYYQTDGLYTFNKIFNYDHFDSFYDIDVLVGLYSYTYVLEIKNKKLLRQHYIGK